MTYEHHWEKTNGRLFLEIEFRTPFINELERGLQILGRGEIATIRGVEYRIDAKDYHSSALMERASITRGKTVIKSEWRPIATMYDFAHFVDDVFGGTPMWLKSFG